MNFNPFENRLCRDVRNQVGHDFVKAMKSKDPKRFFQKAENTLLYNSEKEIAHYVRQRINGFKKINVEISGMAGGQDFFYHGVRVLWNNGLFFECHEWIEEKWLRVSGQEKKTCQAFLLAAVAMEHQTYGRTAPSLRMAKKAAGLVTPNSFVRLFCSNWQIFFQILASGKEIPQILLEP